MNVTFQGALYNAGWLHYDWGQDVTGLQDVPAHPGARGRRCAGWWVCADDPAATPRAPCWAASVEVVDRDWLPAVQALATEPGVTVIVYDQQCG